ncbi:MAG TPA: alpha/beta fold hydrolase [Gaiellaceae bacterium]|nr:alpha/beta fold hydrolase [Gaiellaceae bacterium]
MRRAAAGCVLLALAAAGCGARSHRPLDAPGRTLPSLSSRCGGPVSATVGWFRASDGVLLDGATLGDGKTGVVLAHESPADLCGWVPFAQTLGRAGFRVLLFDHRHFGLSSSPTDSKAGHFTRDLEGAVAELKREGAHKVFLMGASFGGVTSMVAGSRLGSKVAGVVSVSGEAGLPNRFGGPQQELDALAAVPRLRVPFLILGSREDGYLPPSDARELVRRAASSHKRAVLFSGDYHGWDLFSRSPDRARATAVVIHFLRRFGT